MANNTSKRGYESLSKREPLSKKMTRCWRNMSRRDVIEILLNLCLLGGAGVAFYFIAINIDKTTDPGGAGGVVDSYVPKPGPQLSYTMPSLSAYLLASVPPSAKGTSVHEMGQIYNGTFSYTSPLGLVQALDEVDARIAAFNALSNETRASCGQTNGTWWNTTAQWTMGVPVLSTCLMQDASGDLRTFDAFAYDIPKYKWHYYGRNATSGWQVVARAEMTWVKDAPLISTLYLWYSTGSFDTSGTRPRAVARAMARGANGTFLFVTTGVGTGMCGLSMKRCLHVPSLDAATQAARSHRIRMRALAAANLTDNTTTANLTSGSYLGSGYSGNSSVRTEYSLEFLGGVCGYSNLSCVSNDDVLRAGADCGGCDPSGPLGRTGFTDARGNTVWESKYPTIPGVSLNGAATGQHDDTALGPDASYLQGFVPLRIQSTTGATNLFKQTLR